MGQDDTEKTEDPTGKRLDEAAKGGQVPISEEVKNWLMLFGGLVLVATMVSWIFSELALFLRPFIAQAHAIPMDMQHLHLLMFHVLKQMAYVLFLPTLMFILLALIGTLAQVGLVYSPKKMRPNPNAVNPLTGFNKLLSVQKFVELFKNIVKLGIVTGIIWLVVVPELSSIPQMPSMDTLVILEILHELIMILLISVLLALIGVALLDLIYTRYAHKKRLKMTKQEVKDEHKQQEGDPQVKARIQSIRMERFRQRMMQAVETADVMITNPTHYAVAMTYDMESMEAPLVVAKGLDFLALRFREIAEENDVPIVENPPLARALYASVEVDQHIPPEHYKAVAEVIGYVMRLKGKIPS